MQNKLSPQQVAENKAMLMAQLDSMKPKDFPDQIKPDQIKKALALFSLMESFKMNAPVSIVSNVLNECIIDTVRMNDDNLSEGMCFTPSFINHRTYHLTEVCNFINKAYDLMDGNLDIRDCQPGGWFNRKTD